MKTTLSVLLIIFFLPSAVYCGNSAPYTEEAKRKIENAQRSIKRPVYDQTLSKEERLRKNVELFQAIFQEAGYDYNATIIKVVNDMQHNPQVLPKESDSVFSIVYVSVHMMHSQCKHENVDYLQFFPARTAKAIEWLIKNTGFNY